MLRSEESNRKAFVPGDDYFSSGQKNKLKFVDAELEKKYHITTTSIGQEKGDGRTLIIRIRLVTWKPHIGIEYEANRRQAQIRIK